MPRERALIARVELMQGNYSTKSEAKIGAGDSGTTVIGLWSIYSESCE